MSTFTPENTIAFFGATGGCTNACLAHTLKAGYHAVALARTPAKLTSQLQSQGLTHETLLAQLCIVQGDATDVEAVKSTLLVPGSNNTNATPTLVRKIVSGIGGKPVLQKKDLLVPHVTMDNPHITEQTTRALLDGLREIYAQHPSMGLEQATKPLLTVISTTGLTRGATPNDVPCLFRSLYHVFLAVPHADKLVMEDLLQEEETSRALFRGIVVVRPSLLVGDHSISSGKGWEKLRVGTEAKPAVGYTVSRADVGEWIFRSVVDDGEGEKWVGEKVTLTS